MRLHSSGFRGPRPFPLNSDTATSETALPLEGKGSQAVATSFSLQEPRGQPQPLYLSLSTS